MRALALATLVLALSGCRALGPDVPPWARPVPAATHPSSPVSLEDAATITPAPLPTPAPADPSPPAALPPPAAPPAPAAPTPSRSVPRGLADAPAAGISAGSGTGQRPPRNRRPRPARR